MPVTPLRDMSRDLSRPDPLSSPDCDLRGLEWMPLNASNLLDSDLYLFSTGDEFKAAVTLICKSWRQVPAGSLPNEDNALATLSGARDWTSVRTMALRNWVLCSDGRLYHPIVASKAMEALPHRQEFVERKTAESERKQRERKDRKDLFTKLRERGVVLPAMTSTTDLRKRLADLDVTPVTVTPVTPVTDSTSDMSRIGQGHHTTPQGPLSKDPEQGKERPPEGVHDEPPGGGGKPFDLVGGEEPTPDEKTPGIPSCPHTKVLALWRELLPELPQHDPDEWGGQRADNLRARWREKAAKLKWGSEADGLTYFRRLFGWIRKSDWLMGRVPPTPGRRLFQLELQWLTRPNNWPNVLEGKYHTTD